MSEVRRGVRAYSYFSAAARMAFGSGTHQPEGLCCCRWHGWCCSKRHDCLLQGYGQGHWRFCFTELPMDVSNTYEVRDREEAGLFSASGPTVTGILAVERDLDFPVRRTEHTGG